MRQLLVAAAVALAAFASTARAAVFAVVEPQTTLAVSPFVLPSFETPNLPGTLPLPPDWKERPVVAAAPDVPGLRTLWSEAGAAYGIPWEVLAAINKIESNFGRNMGPSSAGAVGWMQFMPDTWLRWGLDADADGLADPWDPQDAVYSAARYLAAAGGRMDLPRSIFAYNHAGWYVQDVLDLATLYGRAGTDVVFTLDRLQIGLEQAEQDVAHTSEQLAAAVRAERRLARREERLLARADAARLLSDALAVRKQAVRIGVRRERARARVEELRQTLAASEDMLELARNRSRGAAFAPGVGALLAAPTFSGQFVFPVGGGAASVSVAHDHHDYPAADIAAPAGSPVYALTDAVVDWASSLPDGRCGIGATLRTGDGRSWTYCHLAYLDPVVSAGTLLPAGTPIGLVGSTGHSTGPHLHIQLDPALTYPQDEPWFRSFAGSAFRWQDEEPLRALQATGGPAVFEVVPSQQDVVFFRR